jgi:hypothetical protein
MYEFKAKVLVDHDFFVRCKVYCYDEEGAIRLLRSHIYESGNWGSPYSSFFSLHEFEKIGKSRRKITRVIQLDHLL